MSKELTIFDQPQMAVPAHIQDAFGDEGNITGRTTVPALTFEGKVWQISLNGEKTKLMRRNADGDQEPIQTMRVVVLAWNKNRGRTYYAGSYDPGKPGAPLCWSEDGKTPHAAVQSPICGSCRACPMAVKGSKVNDQGRPVAACSEHRMIAVVPAAKLDMEPLRMKLAVTSDWDKNSPELQSQHWFAFNNYTDFLVTRNVKHTASIVTKIKFDPNVAFPKLVFSPDRWLTTEEVAQVAAKSKSDEVKALLGGSWTPTGADGVPTPAKPMLAPVAKVEAPKPEPTPVVEVPPMKSAAPAAALMMDDDDEDAPPAPKPKPVKKKTVPVEAVEAVEVEEMEVVKSPPLASKSGDLSPEMEAILGEWGE